ncbi:type VI secretion system ImpA family N-terminal domain-containing protein [Pseudoalteromonas piscicida]|uniref:type VI secretion system ImpA family N-terminal domain-containing protein n=1 Tax=Pseudoalteromonas piscicida TaxID=43662 RepID=UPI001EFCEF9A|nr:type VI secretion system ImpA family N-terminal domain-containing protein [Pseudoalteromonas piscicida]MCG9770720.1 type VI secretion system ImpA family N-terminal domain-containing protein [Pseudoalteromonas piscicida]
MLLFSPSTELDAGVFLKEERTKFRELRNLLNIAQSSLRKLLETPSSAQDQELQRQNAEDWYQLQQATGETLKNDSRDIEVFVWWLSSLAYKKEDLSLFNAGLDDFLFVLKQLGESIHPKLPEKKVAKLDDAEAAQKHCENQTKPLEQLTGDSPSSGLLNVPLMRYPFIDDYTYSDYVSAQKDGSLEAKKTEFAAVLQSRKAELVSRFDILSEIENKLKEVDLFVNGYRNKHGLALLGFRFVRDAIKQIKLMYQHFFPDVVKQQEATEVLVQKEENPVVVEASKEPAPQPQATVSAAVAEATITQPVIAKAAYTREHALEDLNKIAVFFKKTEPHSPIPYLLARAIRWGNMSFSDLMGELIAKDSPALAEISKLTGVDNDLGELLSEESVAVSSPNPAVVETVVPEVVQPIQTDAEPVPEVKPVTKDSSSSGPLW